MALTRKFLTALGITAEAIDEIIAAHSETVNALKEERDGYKATAEKLPEVEKELENLKKAQQGKDSFEDKYNSVKKEFDEYKKDVQAKETLANKKSLYKTALKNAGISDKHIDRIMKASADIIDSIELDDKGAVKDAEALTKTVKDEWSDFITKEGEEGAKTSTPPGNEGGASGNSRAKEVANRFYSRLYGEGEKK